MSAEAGIVISRAVIRDMFPSADAQRIVSQVMLFVHVGWHAIFWFLVAVGVALRLANCRLLPETLHENQRQPFKARHLLRGYRSLASNPRFLTLSLASGMASSVQACIGSLANSLVAGVIAPLVTHSTLALAATSLAMMSVDVFAWLWVRPRLRLASPLAA